MGKVLLTVTVLMLTCFLVIGAGLSEVKAEEKKLIKIWVEPNTGHIVDIKIAGAGAGGGDKDATRILPPLPDFQFRATIGYYEKNPNCIILVIGGYGYEVCW
jgi:hypothetical protein